MLQAQFQLGSKGLVYLEMTCSLLRNDSTEERSNSAFLTKILAGKLPISRLALNRLRNAALLPRQVRDVCLSGRLKRVPPNPTLEAFPGTDLV